MKNKIIISIIIISILFGITYYLGWSHAREKLEGNMPTISSQLILDRIQEQYFLVTKSLFLNTNIDLVIKNEKGWKKFFVADSINAQGVVRVDIGVDLKDIDNNDIFIDHKNKNIVFYLPEAEILDSSLFGDMEIETKKGLWTSIEDFFDGDESEEYNLAARELINQAESLSKTKSEIFQEAHMSSAGLVRLIVHNVAPGYSLELKKLE